MKNNLQYLFPSKGANIRAPNSISGLVLWLDGTDPAATGTPPANGSIISTWKDKSGNGSDFTGVGGAGPKFAASTQLGKGSAESCYSAAEGFARPTTAFFNTGSPCSIVMTFNWLSFSGFPSNNNFISNDPNHGLNIAFAASNTTYQDIGVGNGSLWKFNVWKWSGISTNTWYTFVWTYNGSGSTTAANYSAWLNGALPASVAQPAQGNISSPTNNIGIDGHGDNSHNYIQQFIIYNKALSVSEVAGITNWCTQVG